MATKSPEAFRTISEVAGALDVPPHVLRFWESRFSQVKPVKRGGGRRYYRPEDICLLRGIRGLLYDDGMTIKGVQKILREKGVRHVVGLGTPGGSGRFNGVDQETVASPVAACEDEARESALQPVEADCPQESGGWPDDRGAVAREPELAFGFGEADQADMIVSEEVTTSEADPAPEAEAAPDTVEEAGVEEATSEETEAAEEPAVAPDPEGVDAKDGPVDRKAELRALFGELQALRERMAEGLAE
ncbi:MerR family transcriptional regulator [Amaricoccus macauensis]|uniref:MerR family transcriptional regulator n=1 Tax=Amaricoccus macauensis TaxID=57001 RepID=UPI003C7B8A66